MKPKVSMIQRRAMKLGEPQDGRRVEAALASETPVPRSFGDEILVHTTDAIDMERAAGGLPLLLNHDISDLPVGRVSNVRLDKDRRLRGELQFSEATERARDAWTLVEDGTLGDVSISYRVLDWELVEDSDAVRVTRWMPLEASLVSLPADGTVGVGRSDDAFNDAVREVRSMSSESGATPNEGAGGESLVAKVGARREVGVQSGVQLERERTNAIVSRAELIAAAHPAHADAIRAASEEARNADTTAGDFDALLLEVISGNPQPLAHAVRDGLGRHDLRQHIRKPLISGGDDVQERAGPGMVMALLEKSGIKVDQDEIKGNQYRGWSIIDVATESLRLGGVDIRGMSREQIAKAAIQQRAISPGTPNYQTSDFPAVTENVLTKIVFDGFMEAPRTWDRWCSVGSAPDFKAFTLPHISAFSSLPVVAEAAAYQDGTLLDKKEPGQLVKHGALLSLTWEAMVNDDMAMFARNAAKMGEAAQRTIDEEVYALLISNPTMTEDATALFAVGHNNTSALALDKAGIVTVRTAMARQVDSNSIVLGIVPSYMLVPPELEDTANELAGAEWLVAASGTAQVVNTVRNTFVPISTPRLTEAVDWYMTGRVGQAFEVVFLNGQQAPTLERDQGWDIDSIHHKVRIVFDVVVPDWRAMYFANNV